MGIYYLTWMAFLLGVMPSSTSNGFHNPDPRYNCPRSYTFPNARLRGGLRAGKFRRLGPGDDSELCIQRCCHRPSCDVVAWVGDHCYALSCTSADLCQPVKLPRYTKGMKLLYIAAREGAQDKVELYKRGFSEANQTPAVEDESQRVKNIHSSVFRHHAKRIIRSLEEIEEEHDKPHSVEKSETPNYESEVFSKRKLERSARSEILRTDDDKATKNWRRTPSTLTIEKSDSESLSSSSTSIREEKTGNNLAEYEQSGSGRLSGSRLNSFKPAEEVTAPIEDGFSDFSGSPTSLDSSGLWTEDKTSERGQRVDVKGDSASGSSEASGLATGDETSERGQTDDVNGDFSDLFSSGSAESSGSGMGDKTSSERGLIDDVKDDSADLSASGSAESSGLGTGDKTSERVQTDAVNSDFSDLFASGSAEWSGLGSGDKTSERGQSNDVKGDFAEGSVESSGLETGEKTLERGQRDDVKGVYIDVFSSGSADWGRVEPENEATTQGRGVKEGSADFSGSGGDPEYVEISKRIDALQRRYAFLVHERDSRESGSGSGEQSVTGSASSAKKNDLNFSSVTSYESQLMSDQFESREGDASGSTILDDVMSGSGSGESSVKDTGLPSAKIDDEAPEGLSTGVTGESDLGSSHSRNTEDNGTQGSGNLTSLFSELKRDMQKIFHGEVQDYLKAFDKHLEESKMKDKIVDIHNSPRITPNTSSWDYLNNVNSVIVSDRPKSVAKPTHKKKGAKLTEASLGIIQKAHRMHSKAKLNGLKPWGLGVDRTPSHQHAIIHNAQKLSVATKSAGTAVTGAQQLGLGTNKSVVFGESDEKGGKNKAWEVNAAKIAANFKQPLDNKQRTKLRQWKVMAVGDGLSVRNKSSQNGHENRSTGKLSLKIKYQTSEEGSEGSRRHDNNKEEKAKDQNKNTRKVTKKASRFTEDELSSELERLQFRNGPSTVYNSTRFAYLKQCGLYVEEYNVTKTRSSWNSNIYSPYPYLYELPKNYRKCSTSAWMNRTDMRGSVFLSFRVKSIRGDDPTHDGKLCEKYCCHEPRCRAWTLRLQKEDTANCPKGSFCCWLKSAVPTPIPNADSCTSGIVDREVTKPPPSGMRSAVPLGGLATGSFELRADGTFHEWTIENQSPGGSAKLNKGALNMAVLGVRVGNGKKSEAALLRIHPPEGYPGVESLSYSGAYPVTKLTPRGAITKQVDMDLYAYSSFHPRESVNSSVPAVAFTLSLLNKDKNKDANVSFMFNLPLGYQEDTIRAGENFGEVVFTRLIKPADCAHACAKMPKCRAWTTNGPTSCLLKDKMPLHAWAAGIVSGLKGFWSVNESMVTCSRSGFFPQSGSTSLHAVDGEGRNVSFAVADDFKDIWKEFSRSGDVSSNKNVADTGLHGAASVSLDLKPGERKSLTIILSWYYPHRDMSKVHIGNYYTNTFRSSQDVAKRMRKDLVQSVRSVQAWQNPIFGSSSLEHRTEVKPVNGLPVWLQDLLVNSVSFWRGSFWTEDGRFRQWEAFDCNDVDTIHNDMQRIVPFVLFYPDLARSLLVAWASNQYSSGMMQEALTSGCLGPTGKLDYAGGRVMADTTAMFVVGLYHYYLWTGDQALLDRLWPSAKRAMSWMLVDSTKGTGLPFRKVSTYDIVALDKYDHDAYNSFVYLLALRAGKELGTRKQDAEFVRTVTQAFALAQKRVQMELWDDKRKFYHAWWDMEYGSPEWIMSDTLYGQLWAYTLDLGDLVPRKNLMGHLESEELFNDTPYGLKVLNTGKPEVTLEDTSIILSQHLPGCKTLENITKHNSVWMGADADWASLTVHLGADPNKALKRAEKALDHWRSVLKDQWNIHGLISSQGYGVDGLPWATSHYSFHVVLWHLPFAISGQNYSAPENSLEFWPKYPIPFELPFFTPGASGTVRGSLRTTEGTQEEMFSLKVTSGRLHLKKLGVSGTMYGDKNVTLSGGDTVTWSRPEQDVGSILDQL